MENDGPKAAEIYEKFLGFPEDKDVASQFYRHCINIFDNLPSSPKIGTSEIKVLSIGTGYGRADFPLLKAYIKQYEELALDRRLSFVVDCVDSSPDFQNMLGEALENDRAHYRIFKKNPDFFNDIEKKTFCATGKSASGNSKVVINGYCKTLTEFLSEMSKANDGSKPLFHCIIAILSFQYIKNLKTIFPDLLEKLSQSGLIVIGETCAEAAWISKRPPSIPKPETNMRWYYLWSDWHKVLYRHGVNPRLRLFNPDSFFLLTETLEELGFESIISPKDSEFPWDKSVTSETFRKVVALICSGDGGWKNCVSSLCVNNQELKQGATVGEEVINELRSDETELSGEWARNEEVCYKNGLKLYGYIRKSAYLEKPKDVLQRTILENSRRSLDEQGLYREPEEQTRDGETSRKSELLKHLTLSMIQHLEIDKGCFVVSMIVAPNEFSTAHDGGSLLPGSARSIAEGRASDFFHGLNLPVELLKETTYPRIWLWLDMLYLSLGKRISITSERLRRAFGLSQPYDIIIIMDAQKEHIELMGSGLWLHLTSDRFKEIRQTVYNVINQIGREKLEQVANWDENSEAVKEIKDFWGEDSPLAKALDAGHPLELVFQPSPDKSFAFDESQKQRLFGLELSNQLRDKIDKLLVSWTEESIIYRTLRDLNSRKKLPEEPRKIWADLLAPFYLFGMFLDQDETRCIYHQLCGSGQTKNIWGAHYLFMHKEEFSSFTSSSFCHCGSTPCHASFDHHLFNSFTLPFDFLQVQAAIREKERKRERFKTAREQAMLQGHEVAAIYSIAYDFLPYVRRNDIGQLSEQVVSAALKYGRIYAADRSPEYLPPHQPWDIRTQNKKAMTPVTKYIQSLLQYGWELALFKKLRFMSPTWAMQKNNYEKVLAVSREYPNKATPKFSTNNFNDFQNTGFKNGCGEISILLFRWLVAAIHNAWDKCAPEAQSTEPDIILKAWKNKEHFQEMQVRINATRNGTTLAVLNQCEHEVKHKAPPDSGTSLVLTLIAQELLQANTAIEKYFHFRDITDSDPSIEASELHWKYGWESSLFLPNIQITSVKGDK